MTSSTDPEPARRPSPEQHPPAQYEPYLDGLFTYCMSVLCDHDDAVAALGDVLAIAERQPRRRPATPAEWRPWLYSLARWACLRRMEEKPAQRSAPRPAQRPHAPRPARQRPPGEKRSFTAAGAGAGAGPEAGAVPPGGAGSEGETVPGAGTVPESTPGARAVPGAPGGAGAEPGADSAPRAAPGAGSAPRAGAGTVPGTGAGAWAVPGAGGPPGAGGENAPSGPASESAPGATRSPESTPGAGAGAGGGAESAPGAEAALLAGAGVPPVLGAGAPAAPGAGGADDPGGGGAGDPAGPERRRELAALAWPEAAGTTPEQREALELAVRHRLPADEVATVLGEDPDAARVLLSTAAAEVERTRAALAVVDQHGCPAIARLAGDNRLFLSAALSRELVRHVDDCTECRRAAERAGAGWAWPGTLRAARPEGPLPVLPAPRAAAHAAMLHAQRTRFVHPPRFDRRGYPRDPRHRAARRGRLRSRAVTSTVVATVLAAPVLALWAANRGAPAVGDAQSGWPPPSADADAPESLDGRPVEKAGSAHDGPSPGPPHPRGRRPDVSVEVVDHGGRERVRPGLGPGRLTVAAWPDGEVTYLRLRVSGGTAVDWRLGTDAPWLRFSATYGTLRPGEETTVAVSAAAADEPRGGWQARVYVSPGGTAVLISGSGSGRTGTGPERPGPHPSPSDPDPSPSDPDPSPSDPDPSPTDPDPSPSDPDPSPSDPDPSPSDPGPSPSDPTPTASTPAPGTPGSSPPPA